DPDAADAAARAGAALQQLTNAATALGQAVLPVKTKLDDLAHPAPTAAEITALRTALMHAAAFGVAGAYPASDADAAGLVAIGAAVGRELAARKAAAPSLSVSGATAIVGAAIEAAQAVFGRDFLFLPRVTATLPAPLAASVIGDANLPRQVLQQLARVRPSLGRWRSMWLYAQALGAPAPSLEVVQLPQLPAVTAWAGRSAAITN